MLHLEETETAWAGEGIGLPSLVHVHFLARRDRDLGAPWRKQFREVLDGSRAERAAARRPRLLSRRRRDRPPCRGGGVDLP